MNQSLRELADAMDGLAERIPPFTRVMLSDGGSDAALRDFLDALPNVRTVIANVRAINELVGSRTEFSPEFLKVLRIVWQTATFIFQAKGWVLPLMRGEGEEHLGYFPKPLARLVQPNPVLPEFPFTEQATGEDPLLARVEELSQQSQEKMLAFCHANDRFSGYITMFLH